MTVLKVRGFEIHKGFLDRARQSRILDAVRGIVRSAPLVQPLTPSGKQMTVRMTSAGRFGWVTDRSGYRYDERHPSGVAWPAIPQEILEIWGQVSGSDRQPECCLVNYYGEGARMGLHQDRDEADMTCPVVSVSLGDPGLFRMGNTARGGKTESLWLESGDVVVMGGVARLTHHGVDRIKFGAGALLPKGGRINLTMRVVT